MKKMLLSVIMLFAIVVARGQGQVVVLNNNSCQDLLFVLYCDQGASCGSPYNSIQYYVPATGSLVLNTNPSDPAYINWVTIPPAPDLTHITRATIIDPSFTFGTNVYDVCLGSPTSTTGSRQCRIPIVGSFSSAPGSGTTIIDTY